MNENNNNNSRSLKEKWEELQGFHRAAPILLIALAAFIVVCYCTAENGVLGKAISYVFMGLFSAGAWAIPVMLVIHAIFYADDLERGRIPSRIIFSAVTTVIISMVEYAITFSATEPDGNPVVYFTEQRAGGFIGSALAYLMVEIFAWWGLIIIAVAVFAIYVAYFYAGSNSTVGKVFYTVLEYIARFLALIERWVIDLVGVCKEAIEERKQRKIEDKHAELADDDFFRVDNGMATLEIKEIGYKQSKNPEEFEEAPTLHSKVYMKSAVKETPAERTERKEGFKAESAPQAKDTAPAQKKNYSFDYNFDRIRGESIKKQEPHEAEPVAEEKKQTDRGAFGLDECAENVFTKDFDPFDFNTAEKIATRMSSKAPIKEKIVPMYGEAVDIDNLTEEDVRRIREKEALAKKLAEERAFREQRLREFEARKAALINQANSASRPTPTTAPINDTPAQTQENKPAHYTPTFTGYSSHSAKDDIFAVKENKIIERRAAEMAARENADSEAPKGEVSTSSETAISIASYSTEVTPERTSYTVNNTPNINTGYAAYKTESNTVNTPSVNAGYSGYKPEDNAAITTDVAEEKHVETPSAVQNQSYSPSVSSNGYGEVYSNPTEYNSAQTAAQISDDADSANDTNYGTDENNESNNACFTEANNGADYGSSDNSSNQSYSEIDANSFSTYDPLHDDEDNNISVGQSLAAERSMIEPDPQTFASSGAPSNVTYAYESRSNSDRSDISATFTLVDSDKGDAPTLDEKDEVIWTPECAEPIHFVGDEAEDTVSGFESADDDDGEYDDSEIPPEKQNPDVINQRGLFSFLAEEDKEANKTSEVTNTEPAVNTSGHDISLPEVSEAQAMESNFAENPDASGFESDFAEIPATSGFESNFAEAAVTAAAINPMEAPISAPAETRPLPPAPIEEKKKPKADYSNYQLPGIELLIPPDIDDYDYNEETQRNATKLIDALTSFGVTASTKGVDRGPRITRYEVVPARGVKVSSILSRENDIALTLAAKSIRMEAPIPGKSAIGIEIPNDHESIVRLSELVDTAEFRERKQKTTICLGKDVAGTPVFSDVESLPHLLVAGATGMGKSVCINACMFSMLYKAKPDEVKFIMIDPKKVEFHRYNGIPHLLIPVVTDNKQAAGALMWAVEEMNRRYDLIGSVHVSNIAGYNAVVKEKPELGEVLPRIVIVIDEFADLMMSVKDPVEDLVQNLTQKARAAGIHLIVGTQRPDTSVITGTIKSNIPGRISCRVASNVDSRTIIDSVGAEKLLPRGDMLYKSGSLKLTRVQGAFVSDEEMERVLAFIKSQAGEGDYNEEVMDEILRAAQRCGKKPGASDMDSGGGSKYDSPLTDYEFLKAVDVALAQGQISTALLQRRMSIGFGKAARFIDHMEAMGIVSEKNGAKPRNVLISKEEWVEKYNRSSL